MRLAIIPARGGSKRLPRKNVLPFRGEPMLVHPLRACLESNLFDRVIVSTEDSEITDAARSAGGEVKGRPESLTTDTSSIAEVCVDLLERLAREGYRPELFCLVFATAVFITPEDLRNALEMLDQEPVADSILGVSEFNLQAHQALKEEDGFLTPMWPDLVRRKSQELPRFVASNGTLSWVRRKAFMDLKNFPLERLRGYEIPYLRSIDIDTADDYELALSITDADLIQS